MRTSLIVLLLTLLEAIASAQAPVPSGESPRVGLASAVEKDGKVVIEISELREVIRVQMPNGGDVFLEQRHWLPLKTGTLGQDIRAYRSDGKPASRAQVLNALAKPTGVVYFLGYHKEKPTQPDPFYLNLMNEGGIALAFDRPELATPQP